MVYPILVILLYIYIVYHIYQNTPFTIYGHKNVHQNSEQSGSVLYRQYIYYIYILNTHKQAIRDYFSFCYKFSASDI